MQLISLIKFITNHPLNTTNKTAALLRFVKWQLSSRLNPYPVIYPYTENTFLVVEKGMTGATQNMYCGLHEFNDMAFLLHFLRPEDTFVDVGANIGSYTVLASGQVKAQTLSFEPVPSTFARLTRNICTNQIYNRVKAYNVAIGSAQGTIKFTKCLDTKNHVAINTTNDEVLEVPVATLDDMLSHEEKPAMLKIDVEGYETEVINGAANTLEDPALKAIIIELNGSGRRYNYDEKTIHYKLLNYGFKSYTYEPLARQLHAAATFGSHNTIYLRDYDYVNDRIQKADRVKILANDI